jgi:hypothetical protein
MASHLLERPRREHAHERRLPCVLEAHERELHLLVEEEAGVFSKGEKEREKKKREEDR